MKVEGIPQKAQKGPSSRLFRVTHVAYQRQIRMTTSIVLYGIVLYCIVLYCIVLYCIVLYCIVLYSIDLSIYGIYIDLKAVVLYTKSSYLAAFSSSDSSPGYNHVFPLLIVLS